MAAAKFRVSDIAKKMGKSEKDVIFQLQSLGAEVSDANQVLEPDVIQALVTGKKLTTRTRSVIMREDKPLPEKKKEAVRPPRPIVQQPVARPGGFTQRPSGPGAPMQTRGPGGPAGRPMGGPGGARPSGPGGRPMGGPGGARPGGGFGGPRPGGPGAGPGLRGPGTGR